MNTQNKQTTVAYRCPHCGAMVHGIAGRFALAADLIRLKCPCGESVLDMTIQNDNRIKLSVPCVFCKKNHTYTVSQSLVFERDIFNLNCPYAHMDIAFAGDEERVLGEERRTEIELADLLKNLESDKLSDLQPQDMDADEILPDPQVYDIVRFLVKELEADGAIDCPCHSGHYDIRFTDGGVQVVCPDCGAQHVFSAASTEAAQEYLEIVELKLR